VSGRGRRGGWGEEVGREESEDQMSRRSRQQNQPDKPVKEGPFLWHKRHEERQVPSSYQMAKSRGTVPFVQIVVGRSMGGNPPHLCAHGGCGPSGRHAQT